MAKQRTGCSTVRPVRFYVDNIYCLCVVCLFVFNESHFLKGFPGGSVIKNLPANAGDARDLDSTPGSGRSPGVGSGNALQYSCLENSMNREA